MEKGREGQRQGQIFNQLKFKMMMFKNLWFFLDIDVLKCCN